MSVFGDVAGTLWDVLKLVLKTWKDAMFSASPWQIAAYMDACGLPRLPGNVITQLDTLASRDITPAMVADVVSVIDGIREAIRVAKHSLGSDEDGEAFLNSSTEAMVRLFLPITLVTAQRHGYPKLAFGLTIAAMIDEKLAENFPGFLGERIAGGLIKGTGNVALDGQSPALLVPLAGPLVTWILIKLKEGNWANTDHWRFAGGWESDLPARKYGVPDPVRPPPVWMAQRTTSFFRAKDPPKLTLASYAAAQPPTTMELAYEQGVTVVPIPDTAGGPAMWIQWNGDATDSVDMGEGWTFRTRGHADAGMLIPLGDAQIDGNVGVGGGIEFELGWAESVETPPPAPPTPDTEHGGADISLHSAAIFGFAGGGVTVGSASATDIGGGIRFKGIDLSITPKSKVLGALVRTSLTTSFDLGLIWSKQRGLAIEGGSGLDAYWAVRKTLGNQWLGFTLSYIRASATFESEPEGTTLGLSATMGIELSALRVTLILDGLGVGAKAITRKPGGNLLGLGDLTGDIVMPDGIGLKIDWGPVKGGGMFRYESAKDRYSGAIELNIPDICVIRGVGFTEPRHLPTVPGPFEGGTDTSTTTVLLGYVEQTSSNPKFGLGVFIGLKRAMDIDAIRNALPTGALDNLMFPADPLGNTAAIVESLATMFPPADEANDSNVGGVLLKGVFAAGFATVKAGFLVSFGRGTTNQSKLLVPFSVVVGKPGSLARVLWIEVVGMASYDYAKHEFYGRAVLRNSRVCNADLVGEIVVFKGDPIPDDCDHSRGLFASLGGYHPSYYGGKGPGLAHVDKRLGIVVKYGDSVTLEVQIYLAFTSAGFHVGFVGHLKAEAAGFGVDGRVWFDGIADWSFDSFSFTVGGEVSLILFSRTVASLELEGTLSGKHPWNIAGKVSFKVLWWSVSKSFSKPLSDEDDDQLPPETCRAELDAALANPESYPSAFPRDVTLVAKARAGVWNAPEQPFTLLQKVAPLDTQIDRMGRTPLAAPMTLHLESVTFGGAAPHRSSMTTEFAPAAYLSMDTDAAVHAPLAELWPCGFAAADDAVACGDAAEMIAQLDEITIDRAQQVPPPRRTLPFPTVVRAAWLAIGAASPNKPVRVRAAQFASEASAAGGTFADAWKARGAVLRRTEGLG